MDNCKTCLLQGVLCKDVYFLRYHTFYHFMGLDTLFLRWNSDHFQIELLLFLCGKWTILSLFYWRLCSAKMCIFWDIALFYTAKRIVLWYPNKLCYFLRLSWNFFSGLLRWNLDHFQIEFSWFLWGKWTILRLFYLGVSCAKMCIFWDIALVIDFL